MPLSENALRRAAILCLLIFSIFSGLQAESGQEKTRSNQRSEAPSFIRLAENERILLADFESYTRSLFSMKDADGFRLVRAEQDHLGHTHRFYQQTLNGVPVEGGVYALHAEGEKVYALNGDFFPGLNFSTRPLVTQEQALTIALAQVGAQVYMWEDAQEESGLKEVSEDPTASWFPIGELVIANDGIHFSAADFKLVWKFDVYAKAPFSRSYVYVDAQSGEVMQEVSRFSHADTPGTAQTKYSGTRTITTDSWSGQYRLREAGRGNGIETYNLAQTPNFWAATDFVDLDNNWNNVNPQQDEVATDAHWGAEMFYDYFWNVYGRNSIDNAGFKLLNYVHYNVNTNDAFWDGQRMIIGDGDNVIYRPLASLDVVGHEITHGLTGQTSGLDSRNEPGALNESYSDIFAVAIDFWARPSDANWRIADEVTLNGLGIRNLANPASMSQPDTYQGTNWDGTLAGIHNNSNVASHAFYLMAQGGSGVNDNGNNYTVTGVGINDAAAIAYRTNTFYLSTFSDFADARFYSIQAATDLFGACSPQVTAVADAWYAVGVGQPFFAVVTANFTSSNTNFCAAPLTVEFFNSSVNSDSWNWDFGDGAFSTDSDPVLLPVPIKSP